MNAKLRKDLICDKHAAAYQEKAINSSWIYLMESWLPPKKEVILYLDCLNTDSASNCRSKLPPRMARVVVFHGKIYVSVPE